MSAIWPRKRWAVVLRADGEDWGALKRRYRWRWRAQRKANFNAAADVRLNQLHGNTWVVVEITPKETP